MGSDNPQPTLSVVIPVHNRPTAVCEAVRSVLAEAGDDVEVVVVDDGSTDDTVAAVEALADSRLRVVSIPASGVSVARNEGVAAARADFVAFLDSDDLVLPGWVDAMSDAARLGLDIFSCAVVERHESGVDRTTPPSGLGAAFGSLIGRFQPGGFGLSKRVFEASGRYIPGLRHGENTALWMAIGRQHLATPFAVESTPQALAVVHRRERPYDAALYYESAIVTLDRVGDMLRRDRSALADHLGIAGVAASRLGRRREALGLLSRAIAARPLQPIGYARWVRALVGR